MPPSEPGGAAAPRKVLIVSPHFPPASAPDMQRVRLSVAHYRRHGWDPIVLAVEAEPGAVPAEPALLATLPADLRVERVRPWPIWLSRRLGIGNIALRGWTALAARGWRLVRREKIDLVFFSTTQFAVFPLGPIWRAALGVPYVLDFQDPWRTDAYGRPGGPAAPGGWKNAFARLQARWLEGWTVTRAAAVMSVSPRYLEEFGRRYAGFARRPSAVIPFGVSPGDIDLARRLPPGPPLGPPGCRHLVYTGASGPISPRILEELFAAMARLRARRPEAAARLRLHFVGTSYAPAGRGAETIRPVAERFGLGDVVREVPHRIGFLESLRLQQEADALLILGSDDPGYSPSKIYTYILGGRPLLALTRRGDTLDRLLEAMSSPAAGHLGEPGGAEAVEDFLGRLADGRPPPATGRVPAEYLASHLAARQCALFDAAREAPAP